jgi:hypothetical protein
MPDRYLPENAPPRPEPRLPKRPLRAPAVVHLGNWTKPIAATPAVAGGTNVLFGREVLLEFVGGSFQGVADQEIDEPPDIRVTVGGRPLANAEIDIEVSDGVLENNAPAIKSPTDANGVARLNQWRLGAAPIQTISATYGSRRVQRTIRAL